MHRIVGTRALPAIYLTGLFVICTSLFTMTFSYNPNHRYFPSSGKKKIEFYFIFCDEKVFCAKEYYLFMWIRIVDFNVFCLQIVFCCVYLFYFTLDRNFYLLLFPFHYFFKSFFHSFFDSFFDSFFALHLFVWNELLFYYYFIL